MSSSPLPEPERWDGRAPVEDVRRWLEALRERPNGAESRLLGQLCDPGAAPVLREYVEDPNSHVAAAAMRALGCCGDASHDGPRLLAMARSTSSPSAALLSTLTELEVPGSVEVFRGLLRRAEPGGREEVELLDRLVWLRDSGVADRILELVRERGFETVLHMSRRLAWAVFRVGNDHHRAELVELAVDAGRRFVGVDLANPESQQIYHLARRQWESYECEALDVDAPELADVRGRIDASPEARRTGRTATPGPRLPVPVVEYPQRVVPSRWLRPREGPDPSVWPPPKFLGQPDWREPPAWPVAQDGRPLVFYGQLPLPGPEGRTAYIFVGGPDEWQPLGPGSAVVVHREAPVTCARRRWNEGRRSSPLSGGRATGSGSGGFRARRSSSSWSTAPTPPTGTIRSRRPAGPLHATTIGTGTRSAGRRIGCRVRNRRKRAGSSSPSSQPTCSRPRGVTEPSATSGSTPMVASRSDGSVTERRPSWSWQAAAHRAIATGLTPSTSGSRRTQRHPTGSKGWRWRESNLSDGVGNGWCGAVTCGDARAS